MHRSVFLACLVAVAAPAAGQQLSLRFDEGRVSLDATAVSARAILEEWSRAGGTTIVNGERIVGSPMTLKLVNVPEARALEIILRGAAGYVAAPRVAGTGSSMYDRVVVMPTSSAPAMASTRPPVTPAPGAQSVGTQRFVPPRLVPAAPDEPGAQDETPEEQPATMPVFSFPQPGQVGARPGQVPPSGFRMPQPPGGVTEPPADPQPQVAPAVGAPVPGMIVQPARPGQTPRPPGA